MRFPSQFISAFLAAIALLFCAFPVAAEGLDDSDCASPDSGYTEIEDDDFEEDEVPLNVIENRYEAGRMAFLFGQYKVAYKAWLPLAEEGYANAQASIGWMYHTGNGVKKDLHKAGEWYRKAADQGHEIAQNNLGVFYENGLLGPAEPKKAAIWYRMAADQGYAYAQYNLGMLYAEGRGVARDLDEAKYWLRIASRQKVKAATEALGRLKIAPPAVAEEKPQPRLAHAPYHSNPVAKGIIWVKKQNPEHFTIQLARSRDLQWILRLAASAELDQPMIHFASTDTKGEEWHHLIYGSFPTRKAAQAAVQALPEAMRKWRPWIRRFAEVQKYLLQ